MAIYDLRSFNDGSRFGLKMSKIAQYLLNQKVAILFNYIRCVGRTLTRLYRWRGIFRW